MDNIQWERSEGGQSARWVLRKYNTDTEGLRTGPSSWVLGSARKVKNKHRCRMWVVKYAVGFGYSEYLGTLKDLKLPEALDAARLLIMIRHNNE